MWISIGVAVCLLVSAFVGAFIAEGMGDADE
jgi:uncharacterized protein YneF (UPF0154 family)